MVAILNLYEASYHSFGDESVLDKARDLTKKYLEENLDEVNGSIAPLVSHALEVPLQWRVPRVEARWFIDLCEKRSDMNPVVIELAKLDFDMVQAVHIEDLKHASRWWRNTSWDKKLSFARDRLVECFLWTIGYSYVTGFSTGRREITKVNAMITTMDDVYDVYGTLDELEQFTDVISR
ncbi:putative R-linalool synthase [Helianthus annuus]|nr:putative R-linalool synthase [Helianthus annuus]